MSWTQILEWPRAESHGNSDKPVTPRKISGRLVYLQIGLHRKGGRGTKIFFLEKLMTEKKNYKTTDPKISINTKQYF